VDRAIAGPSSGGARAGVPAKPETRWVSGGSGVPIRGPLESGRASSAVQGGVMPGRVPARHASRRSETWLPSGTPEINLASDSA